MVPMESPVAPSPGVSAPTPAAVGSTRLRNRAVGLVLCGAFFVTFAYFLHVKPGWNVNTRLALTYAVVEQGTFAIDDYHGKYYMDTGDKAYFKGHFYCDKSPALSFLAVPLYFAMWQAKMRWGYMADMPHPTWVLTTLYVITMTTVGIAGALVGVLLWWFARRFGSSFWTAIALSVALLCGTLLLGYCSLFFPYLPSMLCFLGSYGILLSGRLGGEEARAAGAPPPLARGLRLFWAGLLLGMAWFFEFTTGLLGIGLGVYALWAVRRGPAAMGKFIAGGLIPVGVFFLYTHHIFGEFSVPYKYEYSEFFRREMAKGFQGIHLPRLGVLYYITIHPFKGLFYYSPVLLLWIAGVWRGLWDKRVGRFRADVVLSVYVVVAYFVFGSGYYLWWGGWAAGDRNLCPAIPFFLAPLALWLAPPAGRWKLWLFVPLLAVSLGLNFVIAAVDPQLDQNIPETVLLQADISANYPSPIHHYTFPAFFHGDVALNLGMLLLKLRGLWSLAPLAATWAAALLWLRRRARPAGDS